MTNSQQTALYKAQAKYDQIAAIVCQVDARFAERQGWDEQLATAAEDLIAAEQLGQDEHPIHITPRQATGDTMTDTQPTCYGCGVAVADEPGIYYCDTRVAKQLDDQRDELRAFVAYHKWADSVGTDRQRSTQSDESDRANHDLYSL